MILKQEIQTSQNEVYYNAYTEVNYISKYNFVDIYSNIASAFDNQFMDPLDPINFQNKWTTIIGSNNISLKITPISSSAPQGMFGIIILAKQEYVDIINNQLNNTNWKGTFENNSNYTIAFGINTSLQKMQDCIGLKCSNNINLTEDYSLISYENLPVLNDENNQIIVLDKDINLESLETDYNNNDLFDQENIEIIDEHGIAKIILQTISVDTTFQLGKIDLDNAQVNYSDAIQIHPESKKFEWEFPKGAYTHLKITQPENAETLVSVYYYDEND